METYLTTAPERVIKDLHLDRNIGTLHHKLQVSDELVRRGFVRFDLGTHTFDCVELKIACAVIRYSSGGEVECAIMSTTEDIAKAIGFPCAG